MSQTVIHNHDGNYYMAKHISYIEDSKNLYIKWDSCYNMGVTDVREIIAYIHEARVVGIADNFILEELRRAGWIERDILQALMEANKASYQHMHGAAQTGPESIIQVRNLSKRYGDFPAVDNISFDVRRSEVFGILGPNGAGKTTTLEMIEGLKKISGGSILLDGKDVITQTNAVKSIIGVQLQASTFFELLTLRELLEVFASMYNRKVSPMQLLDEVELTDKADKQIKELSGGQKQRFSIAVGLVNEPKVLFLDEPTTGLDPQARRHLWNLVEQIKSRGTTIVITTHYMDEAEVLCDRVAIMDNAKIVMLDTPGNILASLHVKTLEDAFLQLTGHYLRE